jgi:ketosteroid isomerase-like protein
MQNGTPSGSTGVALGPSQTSVVDPVEGLADSRPAMPAGGREPCPAQHSCAVFPTQRGDRPMTHSELITHLYAAFARLDADAMQACYAADASFDDPAFSLRGAARIGAMWRMLAEGVKAERARSGRDVWQLDVSGIEADGTAGRAHWEARYCFSATGRLVHNVIDARFGFRDGLIATHRDSFDFWRWSRQALGTPGLLLGWSPMLRNKVRARAAGNLAAFMRRQNGVGTAGTV